MYKQRTKEEIIASMLSSVGDKYDKSVGYLPFDFSSANAEELSQLYEEINALYELMDVNNMEGEWLETYVWQRKGIKRKQATPSHGMVSITTVVDAIAFIPKGSLFETVDGIQFKSKADATIKNNGNVEVEAVVSGESGNVPAYAVKLIPVTITNVVSVVNTVEIEGGYNAESDESLRQRYFIAVQTPTSTGNTFDYLRWAKEIEGVGRVSVVPTWKGKNSVLVLIADTSMDVPSDELVIKTQNYIDPMNIDGKDTWGKGYGKAPIGAYCTVRPFREIDIFINADIKMKQGASIMQIKADITKNINDYIAKMNDDVTYLSYSKVNAIISMTDGVDDLLKFQLNGGTESVEIPSGYIPVVKSVDIREV